MSGETPLRIEITDEARAQLAAAAAWWAENRPSAFGAVLEDLDRILNFLTVQPGMGTRARRTTLSGVRRVMLSRIRYYVYYRVAGDALCGGTLKIIAAPSTGSGQAS